MLAAMTALLIDLDGVLYEGDRPVPGAVAAVEWLQERHIPHLFLTNTTSRPRRALVEKLGSMSVTIDETRILTPPVAAACWLRERASGPVALFIAEATRCEFDSLDLASESDDAVAAVVVGDYGERWDFNALNRAFRLLMTEPQPTLVALGMTRYWQADDGLRLDTAPFVVLLSHASGATPVVLGKPAVPFFDTALGMLGVDREETLMIGDDIQGDVRGAQDAGITGLLVKTGKYRPEDLESGIEPDAMLESIAELPERWHELSELPRR